MRLVNRSFWGGFFYHDILQSCRAESFRVCGKFYAKCIGCNILYDLASGIQNVTFNSLAVTGQWQNKDFNNMA